MRTLKTKNRMLSLFQDDRIIAVIDTETTGINSNKDRIVQFSGKKYRIRDQKMEQIAEMDIYIKAPFPMPEAAMRVNGITDEFLADKPSEEDVVAEICAFMEGSILVGYNVDFDIRMISALCDRTHTPLQCRSESSCCVRSFSFRAFRIIWPKAVKSLIGIIVHLNNIVSFRFLQRNNLIMLVQRYDYTDFKTMISATL